MGWRERIFIMHSQTIKRHNKSYDYENNIKNAKDKNSLGKCEKKVSEPF